MDDIVATSDAGDGRESLKIFQTMSSRREDESLSPPSLPTQRLIEIAIAEILGTGCLLFFGCMGLLGEQAPWQGAVVFGLCVSSIITILGHISDAHLNPAVTTCALVLRRISPVTGVIYFTSELMGATLGYGLLKIVTPCELWMNNTSHCNTVPLPSLSDSQSLALEFLSTMFLILVVNSVWDSRNADKSDSVPLKFAATITILSVVVGPLTGCSMNPARSLGPALWNGVWDKHWIYWVGPLSAGFLTTVFYQLVFDRKRHLHLEGAEEVPLTGVIEDKKTREKVIVKNKFKQNHKV